jgi:outer membrane protein assembly factor BamB
MALLTVAVSCGEAANWPQWRGPLLNGSTTETGLPATWTIEDAAWVAPMPGYSGATPIVWDDRVFISSVDKETDDLLAICIDAKDGKVLWQKKTGKNRHFARNNMVSPSPIADGQNNRVYFYYGTQRLLAYDFEGKLLWERDIERDHGYSAHMFGYSTSPLLHKGKLYIVSIRNKKPNRYGSRYTQETEPCESYLLAIDAKTGKDLWKQTRPTDARDEAQESYSTAMPFERDGRTEILVFGADYLTAHDAESGKELWRWATYNPRKIHHWRTVPSPLVGDGLIYIVGPKHSTMFAIKPGASGIVRDDHVAWRLESLTPDASMPLLYQGRLYVLEDDKKIISCLDPKTGEKKWQERLESKTVYRASPTGADGKIYLMNEIGEITVLAAGDEFRVLHRIRMDKGFPIRSTIVAAQGKLFIRTEKNLYCIAKKP